MKGLEVIGNEDRKFDPLQSERLGKYVYALKDPRDNKIFYVGQGAGDRVFAHFHETEGFVTSGVGYNSKIARIVEVWNAGEDVVWCMLAHGLSDDVADYVESTVIDSLSFSQNGACLNEIKGPKSTFILAEDVEALGAASINPDRPYSRVFVFPVHNALKSSKDNVYEAARGAWKVNEAYRSGESYAVAIKNGISIGSFKIDGWERHGDRHYAFNGTVESELQNFNWRELITGVGYWLRGNYLIVEFDGEGKFRYVHGSRDKEWKSLA